VVDGVENTIAFHKAILTEPRFLAGDVSTRYLEALKWDGETLHVSPPSGRAQAA
jgi:biotin carboxylase